MKNIHPQARRKRTGHFILLLVLLWLLIDLIFGIPVIWKITRTEAWVRVGDPELHHSFRPMSHQTEQYGPEQHQIFINSLGGKDESCREVSLVAKEPRVAVFGDSFAEGWGLPFAETVPGQLRRLLSPQGVEVLGFGISSHCPSLNERWMKKLIRKGVRWDLALLLIDPGDSYDEKEVKSFLEGRTTAKKKNSPRFFRLRWYEYSLTYQVICQIRKRMNSDQSPALDLRQAVRGNNWKVAWLNQDGNTPWFQEGLEQSARAVRGIRALATENKFRLLIVVYPYPKMIAEQKLSNDYIDFWTSFSQENRIPFKDLSPLFLEEGKSVDDVYRENFIPGDFHWNQAGSTRIAKHLVPWILKNLPDRKVAPDKVSNP